MLCNMTESVRNRGKKEDLDRSSGFMDEMELRMWIMSRTGFDLGFRLLDQVVDRVYGMDFQVRSNFETWLRRERLERRVYRPEDVPVQDYTSGRIHHYEWYTDFRVGSVTEGGDPFLMGMIRPSVFQRGSEVETVLGFMIVDTMVQAVLEKDEETIVDFCECADPFAYILLEMEWEYDEFRSMN